MFENCMDLVNAPELPATTLADYCYNQMFYNCRSLVNGPELPATKLADYCYAYMFYECTSLKNVTMPDSLITTESYPAIGSRAFYNCNNIIYGYFYQSPVTTS